MSEPLIVHLDPMYDEDSDWEAACGEELFLETDKPMLVDCITAYKDGSEPPDAWSMGTFDIKTKATNLQWCPKCVALIPLVELKKAEYE